MRTVKQHSSLKYCLPIRSKACLFQKSFPMRNDQLQEQIILMIHDYVTHMTPRVIAYAGPQKLLLIRFIPHSPNSTYSLALGESSVLKISIAGALSTHVNSLSPLLLFIYCISFVHWHEWEPRRKFWGLASEFGAGNRLEVACVPVSVCPWANVSGFECFWEKFSHDQIMLLFELGLYRAIFNAQTVMWQRCRHSISRRSRWTFNNSLVSRQVR
jgi:hypothetical protein